MLDSLFFCFGYSLDDPRDGSVERRRNSHMGGKEMGEMALRREAELEADIGDRAREIRSVGRAPARSALCSRRAPASPRYSRGTSLKKWGRERPTSRATASSSMPLRTAVLQHPQRLAHAKIDGGAVAARGQGARRPCSRMRRSSRRRVDSSSARRSDSSRLSPATWARLTAIERIVVPTAILLAPKRRLPRPCWSRSSQRSQI